MLGERMRNEMSKRWAREKQGCQIHEVPKCREVTAIRSRFETKEPNWNVNPQLPSFCSQPFHVGLPGSHSNAAICISEDLANLRLLELL